MVDKVAARKLVSTTFQSAFNKECFFRFTKELLNHVEEDGFVYRGNYIPDAYKPFIQSLERVGKYEDPEGNKLDVLIATLKKDSSLERARTMQRNFIAWYLNGSRGGVQKEAALVAFVSPESEDWRFSLVKMEYKLTETPTGLFKAKAEYTPAKRMSYLVGVHEHSHTAQSRFVPIIMDDAHDPTLSTIEDAFSIEKATKEFFEKYRELYHKLAEATEEIANCDEAVMKDFAAKDVDIADFAKKLLGQIVFLYFLQKKGWFGVKLKQSWGSGSKNFMRELFNREHGEYDNFFNDILEPLFYEALRLERDGDYYSRFKCRIPFLNGGLFDPLNDYDWVDTDIIIPNELFSNELKTKEGDTGTGILDIFDRYNFTVNEDEPLEKEVAVDPEMLGKVFENLLEVKDRKSKGTYYTPREIVHYMCQESLINYLATEMDGKVVKADIETLIRHGEHLAESEAAALVREQKIKEGKQKTTTLKFQLPESVRQHARELDTKLATIRVCDPAVGSGAFPVGMMNEIIRARSVLTTHIGETKERTPYHFKRHAIQECLYGVDIDPGAIEIAKLRLWLSLVVDEQERDTVQPLPNLDYKLVCGDSLIRVELDTLFNAPLFERLAKLKNEFFSETSARKKQGLKNKIDKLIIELTDGHKSFSFEVYFSEVFNERNGFDVIIANPPYVRVQHLTHSTIDLYKKKWTTAWKRLDISTLFMELAVSICANKGLAVFISSNQFLSTEYGRKTREFFLRSAGYLKMVDFADLHVFDNTLTYVSVFFMKPSPVDCVFYAKVDSLPFNPNGLDWEEIKTEYLSSDTWLLGASSESKLIAKLISIHPRLDESAKCWAGAFTGLDRILLFERGDTRIDEFEQDILMPVLRAQSCDRYGLAQPTHLAIYPYVEVNGKTVLQPEAQLKKCFPKAYAYLQRHKEALEQRRDSRKTMGEKGQWYGLVRFGKRSVFERPKIVSPGEVRKNKFALDTTGSAFSCARVFAITIEKPQFSLNYLLGLLNSRLVEFILHRTAPLKQGGYYSYNAGVLNALPNPDTDDAEQRPIEILVEQVLSAKQKNPHADVSILEQDIDSLVYQLYGLTDEEIALIKASYE